MAAQINKATAYVWTYKVEPEWRERFIEAYGPNGVWHRFFSKSSDYIRTDFLADADQSDRFSTIDYFKNADARVRLVEANEAEFKKIDDHWEQATIEETFIGMFVVESNS